MDLPASLKVVSLFSGCGGMDLGFDGRFMVHKDSVNLSLTPWRLEQVPAENFVKLPPTRFRLVFANDILLAARNVWVEYFSKRGYSPEIYKVGSIVDLVKEHKKGSRVFPEEVDLVTGGFPCQDFSLAGKRRGFNSHKDHGGHKLNPDQPSVETRGQLYMWLKEVVEITKPKVFIAENVRGLVNLANVKQIIQHDFEGTDNKGYLVLEPRVLQAADFGVPQSRERVIFVGIKRSALRKEAFHALSQPTVNMEYDPYPIPTHAYSSQGIGLLSPLRLSNVLESLAEPEYTDDLSQQFFSRAKYMGKHCQGQTEVNLQGVGPTIRAEHHGNIEFRRLSLTHGGRNVYEMIDKNLKERRLTPRECALIQTFPPDFDFVLPSGGKRLAVSPSSAYKMIGNAVPPLLAFHLAKRLEQIWDNYFG